jgi:RNA polymerase sigma-70 factor, ECF subfamily
MNESNNKRDDDLSMEALKAGDRSEFARMVDLYSAQIYRLALKMLNDPQDAEDVLQETFIKALRSLPAFEGRSSLATWLYRIAVNESLMALRRRKGETVSIDEEREDQEGEQQPLEIIDWCCLPEQELMGAETRKFLDMAVEKLSPALRTVFILRDMQGLTVRDTADALQISEAAVKTRLLRARLQMREELSVYFKERIAQVGMEKD